MSMSLATTRRPDPASMDPRGAPPLLQRVLRPADRRGRFQRLPRGGGRQRRRGSDSADAHGRGGEGQHHPARRTVQDRRDLPGRGAWSSSRRSATSSTTRLRMPRQPRSPSSSTSFRDEIVDEDHRRLPLHATRAARRHQPVHGANRRPALSRKHPVTMLISDERQLAMLPAAALGARHRRRRARASRGSPGNSTRTSRMSCSARCRRWAPRVASTGSCSPSTTSSTTAIARRLGIWPGPSDCSGGCTTSPGGRSGCC